MLKRTDKEMAKGNLEAGHEEKKETIFGSSISDMVEQVHSSHAYKAIRKKRHYHDIYNK